MSRILFATMGSLGDLHPYLAIARRLKLCGHEAVVATAEHYRAAVERQGIAFAPVRPDLAAPAEYPELVARLFNTRRGPEYLMRHVVMPHLRDSYDDLWRASEGADLLVSHPITFSLPMVAQARNVPWVATVLAPMSFMSTSDPPTIAGAPWLRSLHAVSPAFYRRLFALIKRTTRPWERPVHALRAELGLPPLSGMAMFEGQFSPLLNLGLFDAPLAAPQPDWPAHTRLCGSALFDAAQADDSALAALEVFLSQGEPPIVFALGSSAVWVAGNFWQQAVTAAQRLGRRAILITGPVPSPVLPPGIKAFAYLPYAKVFPRAAAIVHQAGIGTLSQALRAGCPQLIVPLAFDQPDNARRAQLLGVGRVVPFQNVNARRLTGALHILLSTPSYARAAHRVATELRQSDGAACAAHALAACLPVPPTC